MVPRNTAAVYSTVKHKYEWYNESTAGLWLVLFTYERSNDHTQTRQIPNPRYGRFDGDTKKAAAQLLVLRFNDHAKLALCR